MSPESVQRFRDNDMHALTQPADKKFSDGVPGTLMKRTQIDAFSGIERRLLAQRVTDPDTQCSNLGSLLDGRDYGTFVGDSGDQPILVGDRDEYCDRTFCLQGNATFCASIDLRFPDNFVIGKQL